MTVANDALLQALGQSDYPVFDGQVATSATLVTRCTGSVTRFTLVGAGAIGAMMPSLLTNEAGPIQYVINDGANTLPVFPFTGETRNGTLNSALPVPAGQGAIFIKVSASQIARGGGIVPGSLVNDWRSAIIP